MYVELMNFEMKEFNIPDTKVYEFFEDKKSPSDKKLVRPEGSAAYTNFQTRRKWKFQDCEGSFYGTVQQIWIWH